MTSASRFNVTVRLKEPNLEILATYQNIEASNAIEAAAQARHTAELEHGGQEWTTHTIRIADPADLDLPAAFKPGAVKFFEHGIFECDRPLHADPTYDRHRCQPEHWTCTCGRTWGHVCDQAEGCYYTQTEGT